MRNELRVLALSTAIGAAMFNAGCTTLLDPVGPKLVCNGRCSLDEAVEYAKDVREDYHKRIDDQILLQNSLNLAFIPIAGLAAFYGFSSAHSDVLLGLTGVGAGTYVVGQTLTDKTDQLIYASGMLAVSCVLDSFQPLQYAHTHRNKLLELFGGIGESGKINRGTIYAPLNTLISEGTSLTTGEQYLAVAANRIQDNGLTVLTTLDDAATKLVNAVQDIQAQVTHALVTNRVDAGALRNVVRSAFASGIIKPPIPTTMALSITANNANIKELMQNMQSAQIAIKAVHRPPNAQMLRKCDIDVDGIGLTLKASVGDSVTVVNVKQDADITFDISGGREPYSAIWEGQSYGEFMTSPIITSDGQLKVTLRKGIQNGIYRISITDLNANAIAVDVIVLQP